MGKGQGSCKGLTACDKVLVSFIVLAAVALTVLSVLRASHLLERSDYKETQCVVEDFSAQPAECQVCEGRHGSHGDSHEGDREWHDWGGSHGDDHDDFRPRPEHRETAPEDGESMEDDREPTEDKEPMDMDDKEPMDMDDKEPMDGEPMKDDMGPPIEPVQPLGPHDVEPEMECAIPAVVVKVTVEQRSTMLHLDHHTRRHTPQFSYVDCPGHRFGGEEYWEEYSSEEEGEEGEEEGEEGPESEGETEEAEEWDGHHGGRGHHGRRGGHRGGHGGPKPEGMPEDKSEDGPEDKPEETDEGMSEEPDRDDGKRMKRRRRRESEPEDDHPDHKGREFGGGHHRMSQEMEEMMVELRSIHKMKAAFSCYMNPDEPDHALYLPPWEHYDRRGCKFLFMLGGLVGFLALVLLIKKCVQAKANKRTSAASPDLYTVPAATKAQEAGIVNEKDPAILGPEIVAPSKTIMMNGPVMTEKEVEALGPPPTPRSQVNEPFAPLDEPERMSSPPPAYTSSPDLQKY